VLRFNLYPPPQMKQDSRAEDFLRVCLFLSDFAGGCWPRVEHLVLPSESAILCRGPLLPPTTAGPLRRCCFGRCVDRRLLLSNDARAPFSLISPGLFRTLVGSAQPLPAEEIRGMAVAFPTYCAADVSL